MSVGNRAADQIRALVSGYASPKRGAHLMAVIQAYIDDSGNNPGGDNPVFVLAGYISTADLWEKFSNEWEAECDLAPKIENFKMSVANRCEGSFKGQSYDQVRERLLRLAGVVQKHTVLRIQTAMTWDSYAAILKGKYTHLDHNSPYFWLFYDLLSALSDWQMAKGLKGKVDFIFDDQSKYGREATKWYDKMHATLPPIVREVMAGAPIFKQDDDVLPLKAADMWAWHLRRYVADNEVAVGRGDEPAPHPELMKALMHCECIGSFMDDDVLRTIDANYQAGARDARDNVTPPWKI